MLDPSELGSDRIRPLRRVEYERLVEWGCFDEDGHLELLRGALVQMSPQGTLHAEVIRRLSKLLTLAVGDRAVVQVQLPLALSDDSEPEPDLSIVPPGDYLAAHPGGALLAVEVAESSLLKDRRLKGLLYAEAGVPEYWLVNLPDRCFEVHRQPGPTGYQSIEKVGTAGQVRPLAFPDIVVEVGRILP